VWPAQLVFLIDVDFSISSGLRAALRERHAELLRTLPTSRTALVVPAFELGAGDDVKLPATQRELTASLEVDEVLRPSMPAHAPAPWDAQTRHSLTRSALVCTRPRAVAALAHSCAAGSVRRHVAQASLFHVRHFPKGHRATDLAQWRSASQPYQVAYEEYYEPYVIVNRRCARSVRTATRTVYERCRPPERMRC
jgi:hypothetical protein